MPAGTIAQQPQRVDKPSPRLIAYHLTSQLLERLVGATMPPTIHRDQSGQLAEIQEILVYRFQT